MCVLSPFPFTRTLPASRTLVGQERHEIGGAPGCETQGLERALFFSARALLSFLCLSHSLSLSRSLALSLTRSLALAFALALALSLPFSVSSLD